MTETDEYRRRALLLTLVLGAPAAGLATLNARFFPAATGFDIAIAGGIFLGVVACAAWALLDRQRDRTVGLAVIAVFGIGFLLRLAGTFFGTHADMPLAHLRPPYLAWLPLLFVMAFVLLQTRLAIWCSLGFYVISSLLIAFYAWPRLYSGDSLNSAMVALMQQFIFGHLIYIALLSVIPFLHSRYQQSYAEVEALKALKRRDDRFEDAFRYASIGMALVTPDGRFISANDSLSRLLGYSREELLQLDFQRITHAEDIEKDLTRFQALIAGEIEHYRMEKRYRHREGRVIHAVLSVSVVRRDDETPDYFVSQIEDVTAEREYQVALKENNERLQALAAKLEQSNGELSSFAHIVSHDLREPLRGISSFAELLEQRKSEQLDRDGLQFLDFIKQSSLRGQQLVEALLQYAKTGQAAPSESVSSTDCAQLALENLHAAIDSAGATVEVQDDMPAILSNPIQMQAVFQNLIANALKFGRPGVTPLINVSASISGPMVEFQLRDNGCGFDAGKAKDIFKVFKRLHGREVEGTGIGLAICQKVIEQHGGQIRAESEPGVGTVFIFTQPQAETGAAS